MLRQLFTLSILVYGFSVRGQNLICEKIAAYAGIGFSEYFSSSTDPFVSGDTVFMFNQLQVKMFTQKKTGPVEYDLFKLLNKTQRGYLNSAYKCGYYFSGSKLVVRNRFNVFLFSYTDGKFIFERHLVLKEKYGKNIFMREKTLYFYSIYDHLKIDEELASGYSTFNIETNEETCFTLPFDGIAVTHLAPNKFIDFINEGYVICDPFRYRLRIYSYSNEQKDSINLKEGSFRGIDPAVFSKRFNPENMGIHVVEYLDSMRSYLDTLDRIWMVDYIDENTLFVRLTRNSIRAPGKKGQIFFDHLWTKKEDGWHLSQIKDLSDFKLDEPINQEELWPYFFPGSKYSCENGKLIYTFWSGSSIVFPQTLQKFADMSQHNSKALSLRVLYFKIR
ncbi:hypothetical protein CNR22_12650 [Sphingobacteriaceae bacterium]|nr:hypothetical protein CNR22_12650 [Sphingobacteriaceae bacterium]